MNRLMDLTLSLHDFSKDRALSSEASLTQQVGQMGAELSALQTAYQIIEQERDDLKQTNVTLLEDLTSTKKLEAELKASLNASRSSCEALKKKLSDRQPKDNKDEKGKGVKRKNVWDSVLSDIRDVSDRDLTRNQQKRVIVGGL